MRMLGTTCGLFGMTSLNRLNKLPFWYNVAKDTALIHPSSSAFFHGASVFYPSRVLGREARDLLYSDRIRASALLKYNKAGRNILFCIRDAFLCTAVLYTLVILRCGFSSLCLI